MIKDNPFGERTFGHFVLKQLFQDQNRSSNTNQQESAKRNPNEDMYQKYGKILIDKHGDRYKWTPTSCYPFRYKR